MSGPRLFPWMLTLGMPILGLASPAAAVQHELVHTESVPLQPTDWTATLTFPRFDPAVGILLQVRVTLAGEAQGSASIESLNSAPSTVNTAFEALISLLRPDGTHLAGANPLVSFSDDLTTFDGVVDFGGKSGETHAGISASDVGAAAIVWPASDLQLFTGDVGDPGTIDLGLVATGESAASGSGNLITQFQTSAGAEVTLTYVYDLDCNLNGVPDLEDIARDTSNDVTPDRIPDECQPAAAGFCEGGANCPCGNPGSPGEGCENGSGRGGLLSAQGTPSVSDDELTLTASQIPPTSPGFLYYSTQPSHGLGPSVFGNGLLCLELGSFVTKTDGGGTVPSGGMPPLSLLLGIEPGDTCYFQYWYRDPFGPCAGQGVNATNGVVVTYGM